jgi:hypothetical protein
MTYTTNGGQLSLTRPLVCVLVLAMTLALVLGDTRAPRITDC